MAALVRSGVYDVTRAIWSVHRMWETLVISVVVLFLLLNFLAMRGSRWGARKEDLQLSFVADRWLDGPPRDRIVMTRAIRMAAPPEVVWPWIEQMGRGAGWYSHDFLDNGRRSSARHILSWVPPAALGDATPVGYLRHLEPGRELGWWLGELRFAGAKLRNAMSYLLLAEEGETRLIMRMDADGVGLVAPFLLWIYRLADSIMAIKQLREIRKRAESLGARTSDPDVGESGARDQFQYYETIFADGSRAGSEQDRQAERWRHAAIEDGVLSASEVSDQK